MSVKAVMYSQLSVVPASVVFTLIAAVHHKSYQGFNAVLFIIIMSRQ